MGKSRGKCTNGLYSSNRRIQIDHNPDERNRTVLINLKREVEIFYETRRQNMFTQSASFYSESTERRISLMLGEGFRARLGSESLRIVDVGCGFGSMALWFAANFPNAEVVGIDPDAEFLSVGRAVGQSSGLTNV